MIAPVTLILAAVAYRLFLSTSPGLRAYSSSAPTWDFLRNSLAGDLLYTALFVSCVLLSRFEGFRWNSGLSRRGAELRIRILSNYQSTA